MKLIDKYSQPPVANLSGAEIEKWDIDGEYEIFIIIDSIACVMSITQGKNDLTLPIARFLGIDTDVKDIPFKRPSSETELYLMLGIDCVTIAYKNKENYKELLDKIEGIIRREFKK